MKIYKALDGIWVKSKTTNIAYQVKAFKVRNNKIKEVLIYNRPDWGFNSWQWWDFNHFNVLTPFIIDNSCEKIICQNCCLFDEKIIRVR